jgi:DNA-binding transcriptional LysR family regulator
MRSFLAVASGGGYSRAAETVHRTQPAVTASVKALERELGIALFERRGRRAALTPAGKPWWPKRARPWTSGRD